MIKNLKFFIAKTLLRNHSILSIVLYKDIIFKDLIGYFEAWSFMVFGKSSSQKIDEFHKTALKEIFLYASGKVPFWGKWQNVYSSKRMDSNDYEWFRFLPIMKKEEVQDSPKNFLPVDYQKSYKMATSGSSGTPLSFCVDQKLFSKRAFSIHQILTYYGHPPDVKILRLSYRDFPWAEFQGQYLNPQGLSDKQNYETIKKIILDYRPNILYGTVSHVLLFAEFMIRHSFFWKFDIVISRSEQLPISLRSYLESVFKSSVFNVYATREFGPVAFECINRDGFHVNEDRLFLEIVDDRGAKCREGGLGNILITSLYNKSMPFIRYKIGDLGMFISADCSCGLKTKKITIIGRTCDFIYLPSGRKIPVSDFFKPLNIIGAVKAFQLVQPTINGLEIRLLMNGTGNDSTKTIDLVKDNVSRLLNILTEKNFTLSINSVSQIPLLPNGKRKLLISSIASRLYSEISDNFLYKSQFWPLEKLQKFQLEKVQKLIEDAYDFVPFYRFWFDSHGISPENIGNIDDIKLIPPVSKTELKQFNLDYLTAKNIERNRYFIVSTSGSTSEPFNFFLDRQYDAVRQAFLKRFFKWCDTPFNSKKILIADPELFHRISGDFNVSIFDLLNEPERIIDEIKKFSGDVLIGYASGLQELATASVRDGASMKFNKIISFAEQLSDNSRRFLGETFCGEVYNFYGAAEFGIIGQECALHDGFHINEEGLIVEVEPSNDFGNGYGEILITSLANEVMPFIRYRIGDLGRIEEKPCPCGVLLRKIHILGRTSAMFESPKRKIHGFEFNNILGRYAEIIHQFTVIQKNAGEIIIEVVAPAISRAVEMKILDDFRSNVDDSVNFIIKRVSRIGHSGHGKLLRFQSLSKK
ncbi:MAG: hypothetical protein Q7K16_02055 [Candidatus Azambacteria bacterium]|nr:hypothetical protein [Candidatus Azambacteria bacterium]